MPYLNIDPALAQPAPAVTLGAPKVSYGATLVSMRTSLYHELGRRIDLGDTRLDQYINEAYLEVASSLDIPELFGSYTFDTVAGQPFYLMPEGIAHTRGASVVDTQTYQYHGGRPLNKINLEAWRLEPNLTDEPDAYFIEGDVLVLWPTPITIRAIAVDVRIEPQSLVTDTDSPMLARTWHEAIRRLARAKGFSGLLEFANAAAAENEYTDIIRRKKDPMAQEDKGRTPGSKVPRHRGDLIRSRRTRYNNPDLEG